MKPFDALIVGGGLHGCSTALHLALRGKSVVILEKKTAGRFASGVNAGGVRRLNRALPEIPLSVASLEMWYDIESLVHNDCGFRPCGQIRVAGTCVPLCSSSQTPCGCAACCSGGQTCNPATGTCQGTIN